MHWKHAKLGKKPEETKEDIEYRARVKHLVDENNLIQSHFNAADIFFRESNKLMTQNEVMSQCARDFVAEDET